jgi:predicted RNA-binding Zn-ribbon protein involved in translation (DUF1610 family)
MVECTECQQIINYEYAETQSKLLCLECQSLHDFKDDLNKISKKEKPVKTKQIITNDIVIRCPKCKNTFSEKKCKCGFKNPLFKK